jgi:hypothetical protein
VQLGKTMIAAPQSAHVDGDDTICLFFYFVQQVLELQRYEGMYKEVMMRADRSEADISYMQVKGLQISRAGQNRIRLYTLYIFVPYIYGVIHNLFSVSVFV